MKILTLEETEAVMILTAAELNIQTEFVEQAREMLTTDAGKVKQSSASDWVAEVTRISKHILSDKNLTTQAHIIAARIAGEHGFNVMAVEPSETHDENEPGEAPGM